MTQHKHAEMFHAIADGDDIVQWEVHKVGWSQDHWAGAMSWLIDLTTSPDYFETRRRPRTIKIGDMTVPEPLRVAPSDGAKYWVANTTERKIWEYVWKGTDTDLRILRQGVAHTTEEGAQLHREALIKISGGTP